jgi:hypothetical protein
MAWTSSRRCKIAPNAVWSQSLLRNVVITTELRYEFRTADGDAYNKTLECYDVTWKNELENTWEIHICVCCCLEELYFSIHAEGSCFGFKYSSYIKYTNWSHNVEVISAVLHVSSPTLLDGFRWNLEFGTCAKRCLGNFILVRVVQI